MIQCSTIWPMCHSFDYGLFWVGYRDAEPAIHVRERLLAADKGAYFVRGFDADLFFVELAQRLECFPPAYVERPVQPSRQHDGCPDRLQDA